MPKARECSVVVVVRVCVRGGSVHTTMAQQSDFLSLLNKIGVYIVYNTRITFT